MIAIVAALVWVLIGHWIAERAAVCDDPDGYLTQIETDGAPCWRSWTAYHTVRGVLILTWPAWLGVAWIINRYLEE